MQTKDKSDTVLSMTVANATISNLIIQGSLSIAPLYSSGNLKMNSFVTVKHALLSRFFANLVHAHQIASTPLKVSVSNTKLSGFLSPCIEIEGVLLEKQIFTSFLDVSGQNQVHLSFCAFLNFSTTGNLAGALTINQEGTELTVTSCLFRDVVLKQASGMNAAAIFVLNAERCTISRNCLYNCFNDGQSCGIGIHARAGSIGFTSINESTEFQTYSLMNNNLPTYYGGDYSSIFVLNNISYISTYDSGPLLMLKAPNMSIVAEMSIFSHSKSASIITSHTFLRTHVVSSCVYNNCTSTNYLVRDADFIGHFLISKCFFFNCTHESTVSAGSVIISECVFNIDTPLVIPGASFDSCTFDSGASYSIPYFKSLCATPASGTLRFTSHISLPSGHFAILLLQSLIIN